MKISNDTYLKLIEEVKAANRPAPEGAKSMSQFMEDTGMNRSRATTVLNELIEQGKMKEIGEYVSGPGKPRMHYMAVVDEG